MKNVILDARAEIARLRQSQPPVKWRVIAARYAPIPAGTLARFVGDPTYEPRRLDYRRALGLPDAPPVVIKTQPCAKCGSVHIRQTCPERKGEGKRRRLPPPLVRLVAGLLASGHLVIGGRRDNDR